MNAATHRLEGMDGIDPPGGKQHGIYISPERSDGREAILSYPSFDIGALMAACWLAFGSRPVRSSALLRRADVVPELAAALGAPLPSTRSLGRLLAARVGHTQSGFELVRCGGRNDNCALWQVVPVANVPSP